MFSILPLSIPSTSSLSQPVSPVRRLVPKDQLLEFNEVVVEEELHEGDIVFLDKKKKKFTGPKDFYTVREGDSLYGISQQFGIKLASLAKMNRMDMSEKVHPGEKLKLK